MHHPEMAVVHSLLQIQVVHPASEAASGVIFFLTGRKQTDFGFRTADVLHQRTVVGTNISTGTALHAVHNVILGRQIKPSGFDGCG